METLRPGSFCFYCRYIADLNRQAISDPVDLSILENYSALMDTIRFAAGQMSAIEIIPILLCRNANKS